MSASGPSGPLVLLYINDIVKSIGSNIRLFADDTSLFIIVAALCLNSDLEKTLIGLLSG